MAEETKGPEVKEEKPEAKPVEEKAPEAAPVVEPEPVAPEPEPAAEPTEVPAEPVVEEAAPEAAEPVAEPAAEEVVPTPAPVEPEEAPAEPVLVKEKPKPTQADTACSELLQRARSLACGVEKKEYRALIEAKCDEFEGLAEGPEKKVLEAALRQFVNGGVPLDAALEWAADNA